MNDVYYYPERREVIEKLDENNINELRNYVTKNTIVLKFFNEEEFDILIRAIDADASVSIINYIIFQCEYDNLNYNIIENDSIKFPLLSALSHNNFKTADLLLSNMADINYLSGKIVYLLRNHNFLNEENLHYILTNGYDISAITPEFLFDLIGDYDNDLLKMILQVNFRECKFEVADDLYEMTINNDNYVALCLLLEYDTSGKDTIIQRIIKYNILEKAILLNERQFVINVLSYGLFNHTYQNSEDIIIRSLDINNDLSKLLIHSYIQVPHDESEVGAVDHPEESIDPKCFNQIINRMIRMKKFRMIEDLMENEEYQKGIDINVKDINGDYPLYTSYFENSTKTFNYLLKRGANPNLIKDVNGDTLLVSAIKDNKRHFFRILLKYDVDINERSENGDHPLIMAINKNDYIMAVQLVKYALKNNINVNSATDQEGNIALTLSYKKSCIKILNYLLKHLDINQKDANGNTLLGYAIDKSDMVLIPRLMSIGADVNLKNSEGITIFYHAILKGNFEIVKVLLHQDGADLSEENFGGESPLHVLMKMNNYSLEHKEYIIEQFIKKGVNVNFADKDGNTPLVYAIQNGCLSISEMLINNGANVNAANKEGNVPLTFAARRGYLSLVKLLIKNKASITIKNKYGYTPFDYSVVYKHYNITEYIIECGFNAKDVTEDSNSKVIFESFRQIVQDNKLGVLKQLTTDKFNVNMVDPSNGWTLLNYAIFYKNTDAIQFLLENGINKNNKSYNGKTAHDINKYNNRDRDNKKFSKIYYDIEKLLQ